MKIHVGEESDLMRAPSSILVLSLRAFMERDTRSAAQHHLSISPSSWSRMKSGFRTSKNTGVGVNMPIGSEVKYIRTAISGGPAEFRLKHAETCDTSWRGRPRSRVVNNGRSMLLRR